jgi:hypothetical protein
MSFCLRPYSKVNVGTSGAEIGAAFGGNKVGFLKHFELCSTT